MSRKRTSGSYRQSGADALAALDNAEKAAQANRNKTHQPFRFFLRKEEECEIIILDHAFIDGTRPSSEQACVIREHTIQDNNGKWNIHEPCIADMEQCPICKSEGKEGQHVIFMSVIALQEFTTKKGEHVTHSKKLLPIKLGQREKFLELQEHAYRENGKEMGMRGMILRMVRGSGDQSFSIGEPSLMENGLGFDFMDEDDLFEEFGHDAVKSKDGKKVVKEEDDDCYPYDYPEIFPEPDIDDLWSRFGNGRRGVAGSSREALKELDEDGRGSRRGRRRRTQSTKDEAEEDEIPMTHEGDEAETDEVEEDEKPKARTRSRTRGAAKAKEETPARRTRVRKREVVDTTDDDDGFED